MIGPGKPLDTDRFFVDRRQQPRQLLRLDRPDARSIRRPASRTAPTSRWSRSRTGSTRRRGSPTALGIEQLRRGDGRQPGRHAGAGVDAALSRSACATALVIAAAPNLSAQNIAFNEVARQAIMTDPDFHGGHFYAHGVVPRARPARRAHDRPHHLPVRRRDGGEVRPRAARRRARLQLRRRVPDRVATCATRATSSPSTSTPTPTCCITKALDYFDPARATRRRPRARRWRARDGASSCVVSFTTDWRFPPARSREIVKALVDNRRDVTLRRDRRAARPRRVPARRRAVPRAGARVLRAHRAELTVDSAPIERHVERDRSRSAPTSRRSPAGSRRARSVLDLGCGDGALLALPARERGVQRLRHRDRRRAACSRACRTAST